MDVDVIVPVFGRRYQRLAEQRAFPSVHAQTVAARDLIVCAGSSPSEARNAGAAQGKAEWLCFLDADDELDPGYLEAMSAGHADLRGPATVFVQRDGSETDPACVPARPLEDSNYLVIGTLIRRAMFEQVGGFREWPVHEDYDLWLRCERRAGATIEQVPNAIYRVHQWHGSRNMTHGRSFHHRIDRRIRATA